MTLGCERRDCPGFGLNIYVRPRDCVAGMGQRSTRADSVLSGSISNRQQAGMLPTVRFQRSLFPNGQTRRAQIGIAGDFRARAESSHAQFQSAPLAPD